MKTLEKVSDFVGKYMAAIVIVVAALSLLFPGTFSVVGSEAQVSVDSNGVTQLIAVDLSRAEPAPIAENASIASVARRSAASESPSRAATWAS